MQKKLIAIAIAAVLAPAAAMADTGNINVYGRLNASLVSQIGVQGQTNGVAVNTNSSRFGVKGTEDLGDGWKAIFQIETNVNLTGTGRGGNGNNVASPAATANPAANSTGAFGGQIRDTWLGLSTPLGTIQAGRLPMENHWVYDTNLFADQIGDLGAFNSMTGNGRANGEILYTTPNMAGFTANVQFYPTSSVNPSIVTGVTPGPTAGTSASWGMELNYKFLDAVVVNFNYLNRNTISANSALYDAEYKPVVLSAIWNFSSAGLVNAQYLRDKRNTASAAGVGQQVERTIWNIGGKYNIMPNGTLKAQYSRANDVTGDVAAGTAVNGLTKNANTGANMFVFGFDYSLSKRTMVQMAYAKTKNDTNAAYGITGAGVNNQQLAPTVSAVATPDNPRGLGVNLTHNF
ncbi:MAG: porin [Nitrosomonadales bacterium]|nr:porin [Nitrosomonadales bacterium]